MDFTINGQPFDLDSAVVLQVMNGHVPDPVQQHAVLLGGVEYPVKQVLSMVTGLPRTDFTSHTARRVLARLGFALSVQGPLVKRSRSGSTQPGSKQEYDTEWAWEGHVQDLFAAFITTHAWTINSMADTATKAHGVDVLASKGSRLLGAEVKGWPSAGYADPRRAAEAKKTQPTNQAGHWFSQALMKANMLLDSHPDHESLVVLPDYPRYRNLAARTVTGRTAASVHVVFVGPGGGAESTSWIP